MDWYRDLEQLSPEQKGLVIGYAWAGKRLAAHEDALTDDALRTFLNGLRDAAAGRIADDTHATIEALLVVTSDPDDAAWFWYGFSGGVFRLLGDNGYNAPSPRRPET